MLKIRSILLAAIAVSFSTSAIAGDWWLIDITNIKPKRIVTLIDKSTIRPTAGARVRAWVYAYFEDQSDGVVTAKYLSEFDCNEQTYRTVSSITYGRSDEVVASNSYSIYQQPMKDVAPDTLGAEEKSFVCDGNTKEFTQIGEVPNLRSGGLGLLRMLDTKTPAK